MTFLEGDCPSILFTAHQSHFLLPVKCPWKRLAHCDVSRNSRNCQPVNVKLASSCDEGVDWFFGMVQMGGFYVWIVKLIASNPATLQASF